MNDYVDQERAKPTVDFRYPPAQNKFNQSGDLKCPEKGTLNR